MFASDTGTAEALLAFLGGPSLVPIAGFLAYAKRVLDAPERVPRKGWLAGGAGLIGALWIGLFVVLSVPAVVRSLGDDGPVRPSLVLLGGAWLLAVGVLVYVVVRTRAVARYLSESYPPGTGGAAVRAVRRVFRI